MTERQLQASVIECAQLLGWRVAHFRPALTAKGWRTPVQADGAGFPDLVLVRNGRLMFAELKVGRNRLSEHQRLWIHDLDTVADYADTVEAHVWDDHDWATGTIETTLKGARA